MDVTAGQLDVIINNPENAHALLRAVYQNPEVPLAVRVRVAIACLPFETPKLLATAIVNEESFAEVLDRRLKRVAEMKLVESKPVNDGELVHSRTIEPEPKPSPPLPAPLNRLYNKRFYRRI